MSRIQKNGLSFFSFDTDFFDSVDIKILISKFGAQGVTVYVYLLTKIYREGFYVTADEDFLFVMSHDLNLDVNVIRQVIGFLCKRSLIDNKLLTSDKVLTSGRIQKLYQLCMSSRKLNRDVTVDAKYWVLNKNETGPFIKFTQNSPISGRKSNNSERKEDNSEKNALKERKEKERKEKENNICAGVIEYLNQKAGTRYSHTGKDSLKLIEKKLSEGFTDIDFKAVIDKKCKEWKGTDYEKYLRPQTLFGDKFESYLNENIVKTTTAPPKGNKFANFEQRGTTYNDLVEKRMLEMMEI